MLLATVSALLAEDCLLNLMPLQHQVFYFEVSVVEWGAGNFTAGQAISRGGSRDVMGAVNIERLECVGFHERD